MASSLMLVASSNVSLHFFGTATNRRNSRDLLHRYFSPRQVMSFNPLVDQLAIEVKTAVARGARRVCHKSDTTGWRVGSHFNPWVGTGKIGVPTFSPKVKRAWCRRRYCTVLLIP